MDRDPQAMEIARERLKKYGDKVSLVQTSFSTIGEVAAQQGIRGLDGVLADLGVSSIELEDDRSEDFRSAVPGHWICAWTRGKS